MKLRIRDNSVRLRLSKSEVDQFASGGRVEAQTRFGESIALSYALQASSDIDTVTARLEENRITVLVPETTGMSWTAGNQVGFSGEMPVGDGDTLSILVEKDFQCLTERPGEDETDMYPHPGECSGHH